MLTFHSHANYNHGDIKSVANVLSLYKYALGKAFVRHLVIMQAKAGLLINQFIK